MRPLLRTFGGLVMTVFVVHLIVRNRTWNFEGVTNAQAQVEAVVLGFFCGLMIVSLISLIKLFLGWFMASTRIEVLVSQLPRFSGESNEANLLRDPCLSQIQCLENQQRKYLLVDALPEIEKYEETV
ncbi:MAG: hypothetical protein AMJ88_17570 [Anaerolineae bacterium SM23_ 63]|nr:MAG: hypothetical protein AMJ88_17570 [Anaerolineae bacterium SM23_ 63]